MNAMTIPTNAIELALPADIQMDDWLSLGRDLYAQRRSLDWMLADWIHTGVERFGDQAELSLIGGTLGVDPKALRQAARIATAFPPHMRAKDVPYEVHAYIGHLPAEQRLETLQRASKEHWTPKDARDEVTTFRHQAAMFEDEDCETRLAVEIIRAWNRAPAESRRYFWALAERSDFGAINEEQAAGD